SCLWPLGRPSRFRAPAPSASVASATGKKNRSQREDSMKALFAALSLATTLATGTAFAQPFTPNAEGVTMGHWHLNSKDIEANRKIFVGMGGTSPTGPGIQRVIFPGVVVNIN